MAFSGQGRRSGAPHLPGPSYFRLDTALRGLLQFHARINKQTNKQPPNTLAFLKGGELHAIGDQASAKLLKVPAMLYSFLRLGSDDPNHMRDWLDVRRPSEEAGHPQPSLLFFFSLLRSGSIPLCPRDIWQTSFTKTQIGLPPVPSKRSNAPIKRP